MNIGLKFFQIELGIGNKMTSVPYSEVETDVKQSFRNQDLG